jgi:hypothetical protein
MARLEILASGNSAPAQANARGRLFEQLMAEVLRQFGYEIDQIPSVNYSGMEIDIEGRAIATGVPIYAECKCYETEVDSSKLQAFFGRYTARWLNNSKCQGMFIAIPGVNSHAKGFYRDYVENAAQMTVRLLEQPKVLEAIFRSNLACTPDVLQSSIPPDVGQPGDLILTYTDLGYFWLVYVVPPQSAIAKSIAVFDHSGEWIDDDATIAHLKSLKADLLSFEILSRPGKEKQAGLPESESEEIVEVRGSSTCFEYQFPASPAFFVGRQTVLQQVDDLAGAVIAGSSSFRGVLFEGNSGLGKSSAVLASVNRLTAAGHFAISIDCRSASSSQFVLIESCII